MISKAVIPVAGLGTRLTPATKELPKEMLPVFANAPNGEICLKPLVQLIFEHLHDFGISEFCFIIGRGKRVIEDHFTRDSDFLQVLRKKNRDTSALDLESFYDKLENSRIFWVNQPEQRGFGEAVLRGRPIVGGERFLVHAGDTYIASRNHDHLTQLVNGFERLDADAILLLQEVNNPNQYGVAHVETTSDDTLKVLKVVEKPERAESKLAILPIYIFDPVIFKALEKTHPDKSGEVQLTDAIQMLIEWNLRVYALRLRIDELWLDIGNPATYWAALSASYGHAKPTG